MYIAKKCPLKKYGKCEKVKQIFEILQGFRRNGLMYEVGMFSHPTGAQD